jgi:hypothetical protein
MWRFAASWSLLHTVAANIGKGSKRRLPCAINKVVLREWRDRRTQISSQASS